MAIASGTRIGPYEISALIGTGGMGEVYRALDTRLKRAVALKILPESFATDPDRLARFQREAELLASLNHPNIAATPAPLRTLLRRCLEKDRKRRLDSAVALRLDIENSQLAGAITVAPVVPVEQSLRWRTAFVAFAGALMVAAITSAAWWLLGARGAAPQVTRFAVPMPDGQEFASSGRTIVAISPDGRVVAYAADRRLYLWSAATGSVSPLDGSESTTAFVNNPAFSPDGQWLAFWDVGTRMIKKVQVTGGTAIDLAETDNPTGMSWNDEDIFIGAFLKG